MTRGRAGDGVKVRLMRDGKSKQTHPHPRLQYLSVRGIRREEKKWRGKDEGARAKVFCQSLQKKRLGIFVVISPLFRHYSAVSALDSLDTRQ